MRCVANLKEAELIIRSTLIRKLLMQIYEEVCDYSRDYNFSLEQMDAALQYMVNKFKHANLIMGEKTNVKLVEAKAQHQKQKGSQSSYAYCSGTHKAIDCNNYKTVIA